jgi:histidinol-phosphate aminotransferase
MVNEVPNWKNLLLDHIKAIETYQGVESPESIAEKTGINVEDIIKLNGNENPYGFSELVKKYLGDYDNYNLYPDPHQQKLRKSLAEYVGTDYERIVAGNGADELIDLLIRIFVGIGDEVIIPTPTFGMYSFGTEIVGGKVINVPRDASYDIDVEGIKESVTDKTKIIFLTSPNNPTGNLVSTEDLAQLLKLDVIVVVDETYYEFCKVTHINLLSENANLVILRTFSKWAGLAGLRIGFGIMDPELVDTIMAMKPPYNVNLAAEVAIYASLEDRAQLAARVDEIVSERDRVFEALSNLDNIKLYPSVGNFILCEFSDGIGKVIYDSLCNKGIYLRYFGKAPLDDSIRFSIGKPEENEIVINEITKIVSGD